MLAVGLVPVLGLVLALEPVPPGRPGPALVPVQPVIFGFLVEELWLPVIFSNQSIAKQYTCHQVT